MSEAKRARAAKVRRGRGGARPGAGRPPELEGQVRRIMASLGEDHLAEVEAIREQLQATRAEGARRVTDSDAIRWALEQSARRRARRQRG